MSIRLVIEPPLGQALRFGNYVTVDDAFVVAQNLKLHSVSTGIKLYVEHELSMSELVLTGEPAHTKRVAV